MGQSTTATKRILKAEGDNSTSGTSKYHLSVDKLLPAGILVLTVDSTTVKPPSDLVVSNAIKSVSYVDDFGDTIAVDRAISFDLNAGTKDTVYLVTFRFTDDSGGVWEASVEVEVR